MPLELVIYVMMYFTINFFIFQVLLKNVQFSIGMGVFGTLFFFLVFTYPNRKLKHYQDNLNGLLKFVSNMMFYLQSGENVFYALESTRGTVNKEIDRDIDQALEILNQEGRLETDHFKKYNFPALDQFHQNLQVYYDRGGNPKELFSAIQQNMVQELKSRDELYRRRKGIRMNVVTMLLMIAVTPLILRFMTANLWEIFLEYKWISGSIVTITYLMFLTNLYFVQKQTMDISVRV